EPGVARVGGHGGASARSARRRSALRLTRGPHDQSTARPDRSGTIRATRARGGGPPQAARILLPAAAVRHPFASLRALLCIMCCGIGAAGATVLVPMSDADLVRTSHLIVVGHVRRIETRELRDGRLLTEIALAVEQTLKGRLRTGKVVVTSPGGRIGERSVQVYGAPSFAAGERVLVFLKRTPE